MNDVVLCVDDEPSMLLFYQTFLGPAFTVETAGSGEKALAALDARGPYAVIVSDLHMPRMDGIRFLAAARERHPDTSRILLTGHANLSAAIEAVNDGHIFRFLTKPIEPPSLRSTVRDGVNQYRLVTAQRDLLENTLRATVRVLGEVLAVASPAAFGRATRVRQLVRDIGAGAGRPEDWEVDVAATLSQIGCVAIPDAVLAKADRGEPLNESEQRALARHPTVGYELLRSIPRLERVAELVRHQNHRRQTQDPAEDETPEETAGAGILAVALDFDSHLRRGDTMERALDAMKSHTGRYDPHALAALELLVRKAVPLEQREVPVNQLAAGTTLAEDVVASSGVVLLRAGIRLTESMRLRLHALAADEHIRGTVRVLVTTDESLS